MLFNIEFDEGHAIEGYLVPDGFEEEPSIFVSDGMEVLVEMECRDRREAVRVAGRHCTGVVGFRLDAGTVPGLAEKAQLTIRDARTGLLIYRRGARPWVPKRIVRLELQLVPHAVLDLSMEDRFQYAITRAERFGLETTQQIFHLNNAPSIYLSGRLPVGTFEQFMQRGFEIAAMLTEPYYEMAERLWLLKRFPTLPDDLFGPRDRMALAAVSENFQTVDLASPNAIRTALRKLDDATEPILKMPLTRQLTARRPEEEPGRHSVAAALDVLSRFAVTGVREMPETFNHPLGELLGIDPASIHAPAPHPVISELAGLLRDMPQAEALLEADLMIYHFASQAIRSHMQAQPARAAAGE